MLPEKPWANWTRTEKDEDSAIALSPLSVVVLLFPSS
jgi:hypothetical protein